MQQRLLTDLENIQMYLKPLYTNRSKLELDKLLLESCFQGYADQPTSSGLHTKQTNIPFLVISKALGAVQQNKAQLNNETLDMMYPSFSQYVQKDLDDIKERIWSLES